MVLGRGRGKAKVVPPSSRENNITESIPTSQPGWIKLNKKSTRPTKSTKLNANSTQRTRTYEADNVNQTLTPPSQLDRQNPSPVVNRTYVRQTRPVVLNSASTQQVRPVEASRSNQIWRAPSVQSEGTSTERPNDSPTSSNEYHVNENATSDDNENVNSVFRKRSRGVGKRKNYKAIVVDKLTHMKKRKLVICIPPGDHFRPVGEYERQLAGYIGYSVRSTIDIPRYPWAYVETTYFNTMLGMVLDYFEISTESPEWWKLKEANGEVEPDVDGVKMEKFIVHCKERMQKAYGRWKYDLHAHYIKCQTDDVRMENIPEGLSLEGWMAMMEIFADDKYKAKCKKNGENREEVRMFSRTGPTPFLQVEYRMMNKETGELPQKSDLWMKQHAYVIEGEEPHWLSQDAKKIYEEIKAMEALPRDGDEPPLTSEDILADILGTKSGRVWGKGSGFRTKKKVSVLVSQSEEVKRLKDQLEKQAKMEKEIEKQAVERENQNKEIETLKEKLKGMDALNNEVQQMRQIFQNFSKDAFETQLTIDPESN